MGGEPREEKLNVSCPQCGARFLAVVPPDGERAFQCPECLAHFKDEEATVVEESPPTVKGGTAHFEPGQRLGGCRIEEELGRGGMGVVYKATQLSLERTVALKVLAERFSSSPQFLERFYQESRVLSELNHPNIVAIIDRGNEGETYYFLMEYVEGRRLDALIRQGIECKELVEIARQICSALAYAHGRGVVHRDIKPGNIILNRERRVKVTDFGLAGLFGTETIESGEAGLKAIVMGTPRYMSPEQRRAPLQVDGRSDIYSLGMVIYEMVAATVPEMDHPARRQGPSLVNERADPRLDPIVLKCLEPDPEKRYQSADELLEDLERFEAELGRAPPCPHCGALNPVRFRQCEACGESLDALFDRCFECEHLNRLDVGQCLNCGADLHKTRAEIQARIAELFRKATALRDSEKYAEAVSVLDQILKIEGKAFENSRTQAREMRTSAQRLRLEAAKRTFREGRRIFKDQHVAEAIALWRTIDPSVLDVSDTLRYAGERLEELRKVHRSKRVTTIFLVIIATIVLLALILVAVRQERRKLSAPPSHPQRTSRHLRSAIPRTALGSGTTLPRLATWRPDRPFPCRGAARAAALRRFRPLQSARANSAPTA